MTRKAIAANSRISSDSGPERGHELNQKDSKNRRTTVSAISSDLHLRSDHPFLARGDAAATANKIESHQLCLDMLFAWAAPAHCSQTLKLAFHVSIAHKRRGTPIDVAGVD